jgi:hypothetical protein
MRGGGDGARIATTFKDMKAIIGGRGAKKEMVRRIVPSGTARAKVNEKGGGG